MRACALFAIGCMRGPSTPSQPQPVPCAATPIEVVDEQGTPIAGAEVRAVAMFMQCGPSGVPEGCGAGDRESPIVRTNAAGIARVCVDEPAPAYAQQRIRRYSDSIRVEYRDWPAAFVPLGTQRITLGPPRSAVISVDCPDARRMRVAARGEGSAAPSYGMAVTGGMRASRFELANLGPWRYWVESRDDRALAKGGCPGYTRTLDPRSQRELVLDRSDIVLEVPAFAGATATITPAREHDPIATATLDAQGRATIAVAATTGTALCVRLEAAGRCELAMSQAGGFIGAAIVHNPACGTCADR